MKRTLGIIGAMALGAMACGMLKADDSPPPASSGAADTWQARDESVWWMEHTAEIAANADSSGVQAVLQARELLKSRDPQVSIDFFNKALYDVKSRAVQRQIRMTLYDLYKDQGLNDKAMDQLQQLMMDQ
jgi:hypothetical protein